MPQNSLSSARRYAFDHGTHPRCSMDGCRSLRITHAATCVMRIYPFKVGACSPLSLWVGMNYSVVRLYVVATYACSFHAFFPRSWCCADCDATIRRASLHRNQAGDTVRLGPSEMPSERIRTRHAMATYGRALAHFWVACAALSYGGYLLK